MRSNNHYTSEGIHLPSDSRPRVLRKWQRTFFYVKSPEKTDILNLPTFLLGTPGDQHNWSFNPRDTNPEINSIHQYVISFQGEGLVADDL